ncbi:MAG: type II secretion system protein [Candidatus Saccharibacteria bacterium]|nr:type II secretion system protein [Candidatus Saccharibacteria bacterium]
MISWRQRGETLIEVLLATTVFGIVAVSVMAIMNRGMIIAERSLEITLVRHQIDAQADLMRYIHSRRGHEAGYAQLWRQITDRAITSSPSQLGAAACPASLPSGAFALRTLNPGDAGQVQLTTEYEPAPAHALVDHATPKSYGIYIHVVRAEGAQLAYDAYIQACWDGVGGGVQTMGTIARLYGEAA